MATKGQNKALRRRALRKAEKNSTVPRGKMLGDNARRGWGDGRLENRGTRDGTRIKDVVNETLDGLTSRDVVSVYSGTPNRCCCGCSGSHRYNSAQLLRGSRRRGFKVGADEINDTQVRKVFSILKANQAPVRPGLGKERLASATVDGRLYIAYLV